MHPLDIAAASPTPFAERISDEAAVGLRGAAIQKAATKSPFLSTLAGTLQGTVGGGSLTAAGNVAGALGLRGASDALYAGGRQLQEDAAPYMAPQLNYHTVKDAGSAVDYVKANMAQGVGSMVPAIIGRKLGGAPLGLAGAYLPQHGENVSRIKADPTLTGMSEAQIAGAALPASALQAGLDYIVPGGVATKLARKGATALGTGAVGRAGATLGTNMAIEGATEGGQEVIGQQMHGLLNPSRDASGDREDIIQNALGGAVGGAPVGAIDAGMGLLQDKVEGKPPKPLDISQESDAILKSRKPLHPNLTDSEMSAAFTERDAQESAQAEQLAQRVKAESQSPRAHKLADEFLAGDKSGQAAEVFVRDVKNADSAEKKGRTAHEIGVKVRQTVGEVLNSFFGKKLGNAQEPLKWQGHLLDEKGRPFDTSGKYDPVNEALHMRAATSAFHNMPPEKGVQGNFRAELGKRINDYKNDSMLSAREKAGAIASLLNRYQVADKLSAANESAIDNLALAYRTQDLRARQAAEIDMVLEDETLTSSLLVWMGLDFGLALNGEVFIPKALMGLDAKKPDPNIIPARVKNADIDIGLLVKTLRERVRKETGGVEVTSDEALGKLLQALNRPEKGVSDQYQKAATGQRNEEGDWEQGREGENLDPATAEEIGTNWGEANTISSRNVYTGKSDKADVAFDFSGKGDIVANTQQMRDAMDRLRAGGVQPKAVGAWDRLRDEFGSKPDELYQREMELIKARRPDDYAHMAGFADTDPKAFDFRRKELLTSINQHHKYIVHETNEAAEPSEVRGEQFRNLDKSPWAITAKGHEGPQDGTVWFKKADGTLFATSVHKLIKLGRKGQSAEVKQGLAEQRDALLSGITSFLSAKETDGSPALDGKFGYQFMRAGELSGRRTKLPLDLKLYSGNVSQIKSAKLTSEKLKREAEDEDAFIANLEEAPAAIDTTEMGKPAIARSLAEDVADSDKPINRGPDGTVAKYEPTGKLRTSTVTAPRKPDSAKFSEQVTFLIDALGKGVPATMEIARKAKDEAAFINRLKTVAGLQNDDSLWGTASKRQHAYVKARAVTVLNLLGAEGKRLGNAQAQSKPKFDTSMAPAQFREKEAAKAEGADWVLAIEGVSGSYASKLAASAKKQGRLITSVDQVHAGDIVYMSVPGASREFEFKGSVYAMVPELLAKGAIIRGDNGANANRNHNAPGEGVLYNIMKKRGYEVKENAHYAEWRDVESVDKPKVETRKLITREMVRSEPNTLFLFGDNDQRTGLGGQAAAMRGEPNSVGVRTKAKPSMATDAMWSDANYSDNVKKIDADLEKVLAHKGKVVIPEDGLGTGRARLKETAPRTFAHLQKKLAELADKPKADTTTVLDKMLLNEDYTMLTTAKRVVAFIEKSAQRYRDMQQAEKEADARWEAGRDDGEMSEADQKLLTAVTELFGEHTDTEMWFDGIEHTDADLQRVKDIYAEVKKPVLAEKPEPEAEAKTAILKVRDAVLRGDFNKIKDWVNTLSLGKLEALVPQLEALEDFRDSNELYKDFTDKQWETFDIEKVEQLSNLADNRLTNLIEAAEEAKKGSAQQSAEIPTGDETLTDAQKQEVRAAVMKRLGDMEPKLRKVLFGTVGGKQVPLSADWAPGSIRIAINIGFENSMRAAMHESMHEFFDRLSKEPAGRVVLDKLLKAANSEPVVRQLERLLKDHPNALMQIKKGEPDYENERLAYMYQFWQADALNLGPETKTIFQRVMDYLRELTKLLSNDQQAQLILQAFDTGKFANKAETSTVAKVLMADINSRNAMLEHTKDLAQGPIGVLRKVAVSAHSTLYDSSYEDLRQIANMFWLKPGERNEDGSQGVFEARKQKSSEYLNTLNGIMRTLTAEKDYVAVRDALMREDGVAPKDMVQHAAFTKIRALLDDLHKYADTAGVMRLVEGMGEGARKEWEKVPMRKHYFTVVWSVMDREGEFAADLVKYHQREIMERLQALGFDDYKEPAKHLEYAQALASRLNNTHGDPELGESTTSLGFSPMMSAINERTLDWITDPGMLKYRSQDLGETLTNTIMQAVKRAEYVRQAGNGGVNIKTRVKAAYVKMLEKRIKADGGWDAKELAQKMLGTYEELYIDQRTGVQGKKGVQKYKPEDYGLTEAQLNEAMMGALKEISTFHNAVMALEGTLGHDISPTLRKMSGAMMVFQNFRVLISTLFSSLSDPMGIIVNGGEIDDAFDAMKRGFKGVYKTWTQDYGVDSATELAELHGWVDAGTFMETMGQTYSSLYMNGKVKRLNDALFKWNGMEAWNRGMRVGASIAAQKFIVKHMISPTKHSERYLKDLFGEYRPELVDGKLNVNDPKVTQAVMRWVDSAILSPNAAQRPVWASDPHWALLFHMKQFTYSFHKVILTKAWQEGVEYGNYGPLMTLVAGYTPIVIAGDALRAIITSGGDEPYWMKQGVGSTLWHGMSRANFAGIPQIGLDAFARTRHSKEGIIDATLEGAASLAGPTTSWAKDWYDKPLGDQMMRSLPMGSTWAKFSEETPPEKS